MTTTEKKQPKLTAAMLRAMRPGDTLVIAADLSAVHAMQQMCYNYKRMLHKPLATEYNRDRGVFTVKYAAV